MDAGRFVDAVRSGHNHPVMAASAPAEDQQEAGVSGELPADLPTETIKPKAKKRGKK